MNKPAWVSQPFPPEGASAAEGIRNQLGKPELDHLTILVRESAQNSWDARVADGTPVDYRIDLMTVSAADAAAWRDHLQRKAPLKMHLPLRDAVQQSTIRVLAISDRGTRGLGGPTRADVVTDKGRDFVAFLRNIGEPRDKALGGGTYGFGKGILYLVSRCGTILVHTRCRHEGRYETRLMGAALWRSYDAKETDGDRRYTGRHWWGDSSGDVIEPLIGAAAEDMAQRLGLRPFRNDETGTTIVIVDPNLEGSEPAAVANYLAETIAWQLWPKMLPDRRGVPSMRFTVVCDGIEYPVPDPARMTPLKVFVAAYQDMIGAEARELRSGRPKRLLGRLGLHKTMALRFEPTEAAVMAGFEAGLVHHVCLMRPAELVVTYWPGPKPPSEYVAYAGVFRADSAMDETFAAAEPPTHDSWNPQSLDHPDDTFVRMMFKRAKEAIDELIGLRGHGELEIAAVSLGAASERLSPLIGGTWGVGAATDYGRPGDTAVSLRERPSTRGRAKKRRDAADIVDDAIDIDVSEHATPGGVGTGGGANAGGPAVARRRRPKIDYLGEPELEEMLGQAVVVQRFRLPVAVVQRVSADVAVALSSDGGIEFDPPVGAAQPGLVGWQDPDGQLHRTPSFVIEGGDGRIWRVVVKPAPDTVTDIALYTKAVSE